MTGAIGAGQALGAVVKATAAAVGSALQGEAAVSDAAQRAPEGDANFVKPAVLEIPPGGSIDDVVMPMIQEIGGRGGQSGGGGSGTV